MTRPIVVTRARGWIYLVLIALAGRRLLWPLVAVLVTAFVWVTWPFVPFLLALALAGMMAVWVLGKLDA